MVTLQLTEERLNALYIKIMTISLFKELEEEIENQPDEDESPIIYNHVAKLSTEHKVQLLQTYKVIKPW